MSTLSYELGHAGGPDRASAPRGPSFAALGGMGLAALLLALAVAANADCIIDGPVGVDVNQRFVLCGPEGSDFSYQWSGPGIPVRNSTRCVTVYGRSAGAYDYTLTVYSDGQVWDRCQYSVDVGVTTAVPMGDCDISGPSLIQTGQTALLCGPSSNAARSWSWAGPAGFTATTQCVRVWRGGTYVLSYRDRFTNEPRRCTRTLIVRPPDDGDNTSSSGDPGDRLFDNCPRNSAFWAQACRTHRAVDPADLRRIARDVDLQSRSLNWTNDMDGLCSTLNAGPRVTQRQETARQLATLLANVNAARGGIRVASGRIGLDPSTPVSFRGARTVRGLIEITDSMLARGRNLGPLNRYLVGLNNGRGIGTVCP